MIFQDRREAGKLLAEKLKAHATANALVLGLARGGVIVADEIAKALQLPLDVLVVRKIGAPDQPELALGAVASTGQPFLNESLISMLGVSKQYLQKEVERQRTLALERMRAYGRSRQSVAGKTLIIVDDGIATGATMKMAISLLYAEKASRLIVAVPVASLESLREIEQEVDEVVCLHRPTYFQAVGNFYRRFEPVEDPEIISILSKNA